MSKTFTLNLNTEAKLREFILADFETYGLTAEDLDVWLEDAVAVGNRALFEASLREVITEGEFWGYSE